VAWLKQCELHRFQTPPGRCTSRDRRRSRSSNLTQTYDGSPKPVTATTSPDGLSGVSITYKWIDNGAHQHRQLFGCSLAEQCALHRFQRHRHPDDQQGAGDDHPQQPDTGLRRIAQFPSPPRTSPAGLSGSRSPTMDRQRRPPNIGSYSVVASLSNANYTASNATGTLTNHQGDGDAHASAT